jgi:starch synthase
MVVLGTGQAKYHELLEGISSRYPKKIAAKLRFDNELAHQIEAGSDMFLMPSRYEPCGLNQLYSLRYGTIPIVRSTGGLADTVCAYRAGSDTGTGFVFYNYTAMEMVEAIKRAHAAFQDAKPWGGLMMRAMQERWSWDASAARYLDLYERVHQIKHALRKFADS